jgi:hypothetical protein
LKFGQFRLGLRSGGGLNFGQVEPVIRTRVSVSVETVISEAVFGSKRPIDEALFKRNLPLSRLRSGVTQP